MLKLNQIAFWRNLTRYLKLSQESMLENPTISSQIIVTAPLYHHNMDRYHSATPTGAGGPTALSIAQTNMRFVMTGYTIAGHALTSNGSAIIYRTNTITGAGANIAFAHMNTLGPTNQTVFFPSPIILEPEEDLGWQVTGVGAGSPTTFYIYGYYVPA